jgi:hypothetical protein
LEILTSNENGWIDRWINELSTLPLWQGCRGLVKIHATWIIIIYMHEIFVAMFLFDYRSENQNKIYVESFRITVIMQNENSLLFTPIKDKLKKNN